MSNRNDEANGMGIAFVLFAFMVIVLFALVAFAALILSILCYFAWNKPLNLGSLTITPEEAHSFVYRGIAGAILAPVFLLFVVVMFGYQPHPDSWFYVIVGGYSFGSLVIGLVEAQEQLKAEEAARLIEMHQRIAPQAQPQKVLPRPEPQPFTFASWDDGER